MPILKIHASDQLDEDQCRALTDEARDLVIRCLGIGPNFGKVILYTTPLTQRSVHSSRDPNFVLAEILMFPGRPKQVKNRLFRELSELLIRYTGVHKDNVFIAIIESDRNNWGIKGGEPADELDLPHLRQYE